MKVELSHPVIETAKVMQVRGMFDVPKTDVVEHSFDVPKEAVALALGDTGQREQMVTPDWNIGLIVGPSGAGKSTVARMLWPNRYGIEPEWDPEKAIIDAFPGGVKEATGFLTSVGLGSPPAWLRPRHTLSTGEGFRADMALLLADAPDEAPVVVDEFTSTVDRQVAKVASHAVQKAVRRAGRKLIAVTCHYDVLDWLQPDWVYRPDAVDFEWRRLQRHPAIEVVITEVGREAWPPFARHHYLSHFLHAAAKCYGMWVGEELVAFNCHIPFPHPTTKNIRMGHRLVVMPDYQGLGLGLLFDNWMGQDLHEKGYRYHKTISHPALIRSLARSPRWKQLKQGGNAPRVTKTKRLKKTMASTRKLSTRSFAYVPDRST